MVTARAATTPHAPVPTVGTAATIPATAVSPALAIADDIPPGSVGEDVVDEWDLDATLFWDDILRQEDAEEGELGVVTEEALL